MGYKIATLFQDANVFRNQFLFPLKTHAHVFRSQFLFPLKTHWIFLWLPWLLLCFPTWCPSWYPVPQWWNVPTSNILTLVLSIFASLVTNGLKILGRGRISPLGKAVRLGDSTEKFVCFCVSRWQLVYSQASCLLPTHSQRTPANCQHKRHYNPSQHLTTHTRALYRSQSIQLDETSPDHQALCRTTLGFKWVPCVSIEGNGVWSSFLLPGCPLSLLPQPHFSTKSQLPAPQNDRLSQVSGTEEFLLVSFLVIVFPVQRSYGIATSNLQARLLFLPSTLLHAFHTLVFSGP